MKKYKPAFDLILLLSLAIVTALAIAPETFLMANFAEMCLLIIILLLIAIFLLLLWRESPDDEREAINQAKASRLAYAVGAVVLIIALLIQSLKDQIDSAVPIALLAMIATKIITQRWKDGH